MSLFIPPRLADEIASSRVRPRVRLGQSHSRISEGEGPRSDRLLDLRLFEDHMLARDGVKLFQFQFIGFGARVLFCDVVKPGVGTTDQLDENSICFGHQLKPSSVELAWARR